MKVYKITTLAGSEYYCEETAENMGKFLNNFPAGSRMKSVEMSKKEYFSIPATNDSCKMFA